MAKITFGIRVKILVTSWEEAKGDEKWGVRRNLSNPGPVIYRPET